MTPNEDLVRYIEDELYKGVPIADVLYAVRSAGWTERLIQDAMLFLDRQHQAMLLDSTPPEPKRLSFPINLNLPKLQVNWRLGLVAMGITAVAILLLFGLIAAFSKDPSTPTQQLSDPNFTVSLPDDWVVDQSYKPGNRVVFIQSPEDGGADGWNKTALVTIYPDADLDVFGKQLQSESADIELIRNETTKDGSIRVRFIEFRTLDFVSDGQITHGAYVLVDKGLVKMSALVVAREEYWALHAQKAEQLLRSFMPGCSRESENAKQNSDGTFFICGREPLPAATDSNSLPN